MFVAHIYKLPAIILNMKTKIININKGEKPNESEIINFILKLDNCDLTLNDKLIQFEKNGEIVFKASLELFEKDSFTETNIGTFTDGTKFRIIQASGIAKEMQKIQGQKNSFSFGSFNPIGYAIHFEIN